MSLAYEKQDVFGHWAQIWLDSEPQARVVVDRNSRLRWLSRKASALLARNEVLCVRQGVLTAYDADVQGRVRRLVEEAHDLDRSATVLLRGEGAATVALRARGLSVAPERLVGVVLRQTGEDAPSESPELELLADLTSAEERVVRLLIAGRSAHEIAAITRNSVLTVRTHVKRIYAKLGVRSKEQLYARLFGLLNG